MAERKPEEKKRSHRRARKGLSRKRWRREGRRSLKLGKGKRCGVKGRVVNGSRKAKESRRRHGRRGRGVETKTACGKMSKVNLFKVSMVEVGRGKGKKGIVLCGRNNASKEGGEIGKGGGGNQASWGNQGIEGITVAVGEPNFGVKTISAGENTKKGFTRSCQGRILSSGGGSWGSKTSVQGNIGTKGIEGINRIKGMKFPTTCGVSKRLGGQSTNRAEINQVTGELRLEKRGKVSSNFGLFTTSKSSKNFETGDFGSKTNATGTVDATSSDSLNNRTQGLILNGALKFKGASTVRTVGSSFILKVAFPTLVTNGAVERVVEQEELENSFTGLMHERGFGKDGSVRRDRSSTSGNRLRGLLDFNEASAAVSGNGKVRMIAKAWEGDAGGFAGLKNGGSRANSKGTTVNSKGNVRGGNRGGKGHGAKEKRRKGNK